MWEMDVQLNQAEIQCETTGVALTGKPVLSGVTCYLPTSKDIWSNQLRVVLLPGCSVRVT